MCDDFDTVTADLADRSCDTNHITVSCWDYAQATPWYLRLWWDIQDRWPALLRPSSWYCWHTAVKKRGLVIRDRGVSFILWRGLEIYVKTKRSATLVS